MIRFWLFLAFSIAAPAQTRIACGTTGPVTDPATGLVFQADQNFTGGSANTNATAPLPLEFQSARYGTFRYNLPVPDGTYTVNLYFAEILPQIRAGQRQLSVSINGRSVLKNYDIVADAGSALRPVVQSFPIIVFGGAGIVIQTGTNRLLAQINAIEILPAIQPDKFVPYTGATRNLDMGQFIVIARELDAGVPGEGSRIYLTAGTPPPSTTDSETGKVYPAVLFLGTDLTLQMLKADGSITPVALNLTRAQCQNQTAPCAPGIELWTLGTNPFLTVPATPEAIALPACPASGPCWQKITR